MAHTFKDTRRTQSGTLQSARHDDRRREIRFVSQVKAKATKAAMLQAITEALFEAEAEHAEAQAIRESDEQAAAWYHRATLGEAFDYNPSAFAALALETRSDDAGLYVAERLEGNGSAYLSRSRGQWLG